MATLTLNIVGGGVVKRESTIYKNSTNSIPVGLNTDLSLVADPSDNYAFVRWTGANTSTDASITIRMNTNKTLTANFVQAPIVTRRKYWPSQTELADDSKPCRCACFKRKGNYASFAERDRALRFAAAGCNCCTQQS